MSKAIEQNESAFDRGLENWINRMRSIQQLIYGISEFSVRTLVKATVAYAFFNPIEAYGYFTILRQTGVKGARAGGRLFAQEIAQKITWGKIIAEEGLLGKTAQRAATRRTGLTLTERLAQREARRAAVSATSGLGGALLAAEIYVAMEQEVNATINNNLGLTRGFAEEGVAPPAFIGGGSTF